MILLYGFLVGYGWGWLEEWGTKAWNARLQKKRTPLGR